ncbi:plasma membrane fusion protein prm1 [Tulasnella sp. 419]|nr:plasma membrane fusion protein prm1 [Tulasnella sp. 419]
MSFSIDHSRDENHQQQRWNSPPPTYTNATVPPTKTTPYLTLKHHLSLTWLATPILSLIFVAFRIFASSADSQAAAEDAKRNLIASCKAAENAATVAASLPRYMAEGTNRLIEKSVNGSIEVARDTMVFSLTALQGIIEFVIDIYRSTFLCFLELILRGSIAALIGAAEEISNFIENTLSGLRTTIQEQVQNANSVIAAAVNGINQAIPDFLNIDLTVPQFDIPALNGLQNVQLPTTIQDGLTNLNSTIPTVDDIREKLDAIIAVPFDNLKKEINGSFSTIKYSPVALPERQTLSFCAEMDTSVVDDLARDIVRIAKIGSFVLLAVVVLLILGNCFIEWYQWRMLKRRLEDIREGWGRDPALLSGPPATPGGTSVLELSDRNLFTLFSSMQHPISTTVAAKIASLLRLSNQKHINLRFFFYYIFSPPALACLLIGVFGVLSVELQLAAVGPIQRHYSAAVSDSINDFTNTIATNINANMLAQSSSYAKSVNSQIEGLQSNVNNGVFGWVNGTVVPLNNTLQAFYEDIQGAVDKVFGGTVLATPAQEFIRCLIGTKVVALENAFTFMQENFQVQVAPVDPNVLVLSDTAVQEATKPISEAAVGGDTEDNTGLVGRLVNRYVEALEKERLMFMIFLFLWGLVVIMAILFIAYNSYGKSLILKYRKRRYDRRAQAGLGGEAVVTPWTTTGSNSEESFDEPKTPGTKEREGLNFANKTFADSSVFRPNISLPLALQPVSRWEGDARSATGNNKLKAIGRRALGRETLVPDEKASGTGGSNSEETGLSASNTSDRGFFSRLGGLFGHRNGSEDDEDMIRPTHPRSNSIESFGNAPAATITPTPNMNLLVPKPYFANLDSTARADRASYDSRLSSTHLPPPRPLPASNNATPPANQGNMARQTGRGQRDVPRSISGASIYGSPPEMSGLAVRHQPEPSVLPIHHHFVSQSDEPRVPTRSISQTVKQPASGIHSKQSRQSQHLRTPSMNRLLTPQSRKSSLVDPALVNLAGVGAGRRDESSRVTQPTTPTASRNPFANPFDDDHVVSSYSRRKSMAPRLSVTNPDPFEPST